MPAIPRAALLVETAWLADHLEDPRLVVVDIRGSIKPPTAPTPHYVAKRDAYHA
jgi:thiosulfate/3-mercaptopyruvate sulfurtransferase